MKRWMVSVVGLAALVACGSSEDSPQGDVGAASSSSSSGSSSGQGAGSSSGSGASSSSSSSGAPSQPVPMPEGFTQVPLRSEQARHSFDAAESVLEDGQDYIAVIEVDLDGAGKQGRLVADLFEQETPQTVNSFVFLALHRYFEQIAFHRVIDEFMAQTGDPNSIDGASRTWGTGGPGYSFGLEVRPELTFDGPGVLGMARTNDPNSNGSQFFITFEATPSLDQEYTVWGKLTEGLELLPDLVRGEPPTTPSRIVRVGIGVKAR